MKKILIIIAIIFGLAGMAQAQYTSKQVQLNRITGLILTVLIVICVCAVRGFSQTVTQLDSDKYFVQFDDGTNETISNQQVSTNVRTCYQLWQRYGPVLNQINQNAEAMTQAQFIEAQQSIAAQPAGSLNTGSQVNTGS